MATILITGGSGLVGTALTEKLLERGDEVIILSRSMVRPQRAGLQYAQWNIEAQTIDSNALLKADFIIHLAGAGIADKRWSGKRKKEIQDSRVQSSLLLANSLIGLNHKVKAVVSASAIGWYGADRGGAPFKESDPPSTDFLGETCRLWEESVERIGEAGPRIVKFRTGIVLSREGGALKEFLKPMKFGIAPIMGNGQQIMSWIHIDDLVNLYIAAIENENIAGAYNAVAAHPVSNKEFIKAVSKARKGISVPIQIPAAVLKLILGEMSIEVLKSCLVNNDKIRQAGFHFKFDSISLALVELIRISTRLQQANG